MTVEQEELKIRRARFVEEYLVDFNGTKAAIRAGYAPSGAGTEAYRLLKNAQIKKAIEKRKAEILAEISVDQFRISRELSRIAFHDVRQLYNESGELKQPRKMDCDSAAAVVSIETVRRSLPGEEDENGNPVFETVLKVRTHDKIRALELLGKHTGMFADQAQGNAVQIVYLSEKPKKPDDAGTG